MQSILNSSKRCFLPLEALPNPRHPQEFQAIPDTQRTTFSRRPNGLRKDAELLRNQHGYTYLWCLVSRNSVSSSRTDTMSSSLGCSICLGQGLVGNQHHRKLEEGALQTLEEIGKWPFTLNDWMSLQNVSYLSYEFPNRTTSQLKQHVKLNARKASVSYFEL